MKKPNPTNNNAKRTAISSNSTKHPGLAPKPNAPAQESNLQKQNNLPGNYVTGSKVFSSPPNSNNNKTKLPSKTNVIPGNPISSNQNQEDELISQEENKHEEKIIIHVCDENRKINKDFKCEKDLLLSHMKYFENLKYENPNLEDLDISVHCDIKIFEWLMTYLHDPISQIANIDVSSAISILISAEYLQMAELVEECISFIHKQFVSVMKLQIDMNCLSTKVLKKLAQMIDITELDEMKERKDKVISKLYMKKLEILFEDENNILHRCVYCNQLFTSAQKEWMLCSKAKLFIDFHGSVIAEHVADRGWDINKFIHYLRQQALSWKEIYWKMWARLTVFSCSVCDSNFVGSDVLHCSFHPHKPKFNSGVNSGVYPCCNAVAIRFDTSIKRRGCTANEHKLVANCSEDEIKNFNEIKKRIQIVAEPFIPEFRFDETIASLDESYKRASQNNQNLKANADSLPLSKIEDSPCLQLLVFKFMKTCGNTNNDESEEDEEEEEPEKQEWSDSETTNTKETPNEKQPTEENSEEGKEDKKKAKKQNHKQKRVKTLDANPEKQKAWKLDYIRNEDRDLMQNLIKKLTKCRNEELFIKRQAANTNTNLGKGSLNNKPIPKAIIGQNPQRKKIAAKNKSKK